MVLSVKTIMHFCSYLAQFFFQIRNVSNKSCRENQNILLCPKKNFFPRKSYCLWDNAKKNYRAGQATDGNILWCMRIACCLSKVTHTHTHTLSVYITYCFSTATMFTRTCFNVTLYVPCLPCLFLYPRRFGLNQLSYGRSFIFADKHILS